MNRRPPNRERQGGYRERPEPEPKPFDKVLISKGAERRKITGHEKFYGEYSGKLVCLLKVVTPVHVGSGIYELVGDMPVRGLVSAEGKVIIPGSSLKGAVRSVVEAISNSCVRITRRSVQENLARSVEVRECNDKELKKGNLCVACRIFGSLGYQGRVSFSDAVLTKGNLELHRVLSPYPPREAARVYKNQQGKFDGRKFYYHGQPASIDRGEPYQVIQRGSEMHFTFQFDSLEAEEFCLVLVAMGILDDVKIKVGGAKQAMLGTVEVFPQRLELRKAQASFLDMDGGITVVSQNLIDYLVKEVGSANELINEDAFTQLKAIWKFPSDRKAPTTIY